MIAKAVKHSAALTTKKFLLKTGYFQKKTISAQTIIWRSSQIEKLSWSKFEQLTRARSGWLAPYLSLRSCHAKSDRIVNGHFWRWCLNGQCLVWNFNLHVSAALNQSESLKQPYSLRIIMIVHKVTIFFCAITLISWEYVCRFRARVWDGEPSVTKALWQYVG